MSDETRNHRNLTRDDVAYDSYEDYIDSRIIRYLDAERISTVDHSWDYVHDAKRLYETGVFGGLLQYLEREPCRERWEYLKTADCTRCGKPDVGLFGYMRATETPSGETAGFHQHSTLCEPCADQIMDDLKTTGTVQPTLTQGEWWQPDEVSAR